jgi:predicted GNAT family acetyltransferase
VDVRRIDDPAEFLRRAETLLLEDEGRHNLILGLAGTIARHPELYASFHLWTVEDGATVVGAALRTPPHRLVLAKPRSSAAIAALVEAIDDDLPGLVGITPDVDEFASLWASKRGARIAKRRAQGVYALEHVTSGITAPGAPRAAEEGDRDLLTAWWRAFDVEALGQSRSAEQIARAVDHGLHADDAGIVLWEDGGRPVSLAGYGGPTPSGIRIGPVYTPPEHRSRGYASALVAALSAEHLAAGRRFCFLYTDLANPVANRIYERIGYVRICESAELDFG